MSGDSFDFTNPDERHEAAEQMAKDWREGGGVLHPGISYVRLEPGEYVLSGEDIRRLLEDAPEGGES